MKEGRREASRRGARGETETLPVLLHSPRKSKSQSQVQSASGEAYAALANNDVRLPEKRERSPHHPPAALVTIVESLVGARG